MWVYTCFTLYVGYLYRNTNSLRNCIVYDVSIVLCPYVCSEEDMAVILEYQLGHTDWNLRHKILCRLRARVLPLLHQGKIRD